MTLTAQKLAGTLADYRDWTERHDSSSRFGPLVRSVGVNASTWLTWFRAEKDAGVGRRDREAAESAVESLHEGGINGKGTHHLCRDDLVGLSNELTAALATTDPVETDGAFIRLFVATQMWGSGTTNGRGPRYTQRALNDRERLHSSLRDSRTAARDGDLPLAYGSFQCSGVGPAFFTKWLWSSTLDLEMSERPLIFDARVAQTLTALGWRPKDAGTKRSSRYGHYVELLHEAGRTAVPELDGEQVEFLLFDRGDGCLIDWIRSTAKVR